MQAAELPPEQMDSILQVLTEEGVEIVDTTSEADEEEAEDAAPAASRKKKSSRSRPRPPTRCACT